ncbi:uncharacterized protein LOC124182170 [Neodiprion fabricii]|uniref:uncharacterized protein LOC124182170 n=1 Tax=Neodiprion fabricii TaxID=2872261 RepID=UPI001ED9358A|nr:uncharacterized protein LOC124182170 [Neodiprion fabricii]
MASADTYADDQLEDPLDFETPEIEIKLTEMKTARYFTITTDSYISLCSRVYAALCAENPEFSANFSESVFQYYAVIHLWMRFAAVLPNSMQRTSHQFLAEMYKLNNESWHVPKPLLTYLKGIGNFRDVDNCERQFQLPVLPTHESIGGVKYTFGKINANTHHFYEAFPAPGIAALRIQADIKYTENFCNENLFWDLPDDLRPDAIDSRIKSCDPTKNLLGWAPAQELTSKQLELCQWLDMNEFLNNKVSTLSSHALEMLRSISNSLCPKQKEDDSDCSLCKTFDTLPQYGSLVQGTFVEKHDKFVKFDRSAMYCDGNISLRSQFMLNDDLAKSAIISGYRMIKDSIGDRHCWSCYDYDEYKNVPANWIRSRNMVYVYDSTEKFDEIRYISAYISKRILQNVCILNSMIKDSTWSIYE